MKPELRGEGVQVQRHQSRHLQMMRLRMMLRGEDQSHYLLLGAMRTIHPAAAVVVLVVAVASDWKVQTSG